MNKIKPITPDDARIKKNKLIPEEIIQATNELIAEGLGNNEIWGYLLPRRNQFFK